MENQTVVNQNTIWKNESPFTIIIIKKGRQYKAEREWYKHTISPKTTASQNQPIDRKKIMGKIVGIVK